MKKQFVRAIVITAVVAAIALSAAPHNVSKAADATTIRIYVGLGAGTQPGQITAEQALEQQWNSSHTDIKIQFEIVTNGPARDALLTEAAGDNPPDIVGPVGIKGLYDAGDLWADLTKMIADNKVDLKDLDPATLKLYQLNGKEIAIPLGIYPSFLFVNKDLFKQAGVALPPTTYGPKGVATYDGKPWDMTALRTVAMKVTIDANGKAADEAGFDPKNIASYGFSDSWSDLRGWGSHFAPRDVGVTADGKPDFSQPAYVAAMKWYNDAIWKDHFYPGKDANANLKPNDFASGQVAMEYAPTWFDWWTADAKFDWGLAVAPAAPGGDKLVARMNADTFAIVNKSKNKDAAFKVLTWLTGDGEAQICAIYGCLPARKSAQPKWEEGIKKAVPQYDLSIIYGAIPYLDAPNYEGYLPNYSKSWDAMQTVYTSIYSAGVDDPEAALKDLDSKLATIYTQSPAAVQPGAAVTMQVIDVNATAAPTAAK